MVEYSIQIDTDRNKPGFTFESTEGDRFVVIYSTKEEMLLVLYKIRKAIRVQQPSSWGKLKALCYKICIDHGVSNTTSKDK